MIKKITFKNFFSFRGTEIELTNENILIGINGSGKTNFLRALELLKAIANGKLRDLIVYKWGGFNEVLFAGDSFNSNSAEIKIELANDWETSNFPVKLKSATYNIRLIKSGFVEYIINEWIKISFVTEDGKREITPLTLLKDQAFVMNNAQIKNGGEENWFKVQDRSESLYGPYMDTKEFSILNHFYQLFWNIEFYREFATGPNSPIRKPIIATSEQRLSADGGNLIQILNTISINNHNFVKEIKGKLKEVNPNFEEYGYNIFGGGTIELILHEVGLTRPIHISKISDGTLKFLCLMAIFYNPNRGSVICIDEPEIGLHPDMISAVADGIKHAALTSQMIIATHSDHLLNHFALSNILVFKKDERNATAVNRLTEEEYGKWLDDYTIGDLWRKGVIGGNRW